MKRILRIAALLLFLLPGIAKAQWTFDIVSVEAYINDHKKQRSLLLARSTLEYSNKLLHEYSCKEVGGYKELNIDLDRYTRAFDVIDVMYQSLRTVLNVKNTYTSVSDRIGDYKSLLEDFNAKILKRGRVSGRSQHISLQSPHRRSFTGIDMNRNKKIGFTVVGDLAPFIQLYRHVFRPGIHHPNIRIAFRDHLSKL